ncbi:MAG: hypothetical protein HYU66_29045 [Armatimonadetes bacterium]|nr:hypothetical protein [Armatimonadota bacterium]
MGRREAEGEVVSEHVARQELPRRFQFGVVLGALGVVLGDLLHWVCPVDSALPPLVAVVLLAIAIPLQLCAWPPPPHRARVTTAGIKVRSRFRWKWLPWEAIREVEESEVGLKVSTDRVTVTLWHDLPQWEALCRLVRAFVPGSASPTCVDAAVWADPREVLGSAAIGYESPLADWRTFVRLAAVATTLIVLLPLRSVVGGAEVAAATFLVALAVGTVSLAKQQGLQHFSLTVSAAGIRPGVLRPRVRMMAWSEVIALHDHRQGWRLETTRGDFLIQRRGRHGYAAANAIRKVLALRDQGLPLPRMDMTPAGAISRVDVSAERGLMRAEEADGESES